MADAEPAAIAPKHRRFAELGAVLARAVAAGEVEATYALRVLRHQLRTMNVNNALRAPLRSTGAQAVIDRYAAAGEAVPKNGSPDALHSDHTHPLTVADLERLQTVEQWIAELPRLTEVVCLTAAENYSLERVERDGHTGPAKYQVAGITLIPATPGPAAT